MANGKLVWDVTGKHLYETGVDRGVLYTTLVESDDNDYAQKAYKNGVVWNGLTGFTESPEGAEANAIYADNIKYLNLRSAEDYGATITAYTYPEEFEACNGQKKPTGAVGMYVGQQERKAFGFSCRTLVGNDTEGDAFGYKIHLVYGCSVSPSERAYQTVNDSPEAIEFSWDVDTVPLPASQMPDGFKPAACVTIDTTKMNLKTSEGQDGPDKTKLDALETALYGADNAEPYLPTPKQVATLLS